MIELRKHMSAREREDLIGERIRFTVKRAGEVVERSQTITRVSATCVWCGAYLYSIDELQNVRSVE